MRKFTIIAFWLLVSCTWLYGVACDSAFAHYPQVVFCPSDPIAAPDSVFPVNGFFRSPSIGLNIDSLGNIRPTLSFYGLHEVQYIARDSCADTFRVMITILPSVNPGFFFQDTLYCNDGPDPVPIIGGMLGGEFSGPIGLVIDSVSGSIDLGTSIPGFYQIKYVVGNLCPDSSYFPLWISSRGNAAFLYPDSSYCANDPDPGPVILGDTAGKFSGPPGLVLERISGIVDLSASTPGNYLVSYASPGPCPDTAYFPIQIQFTPNPTFIYPNPICLSDTNPIPQTITPGGIFSCNNSSLSFANQSTGEISLAQSQSGPYLISYVTMGTCPDSATFLLSLLAQNPASFTYPDTHYCQGSGHAAPVLSGQGGGRYFSPSPVLRLDSLTGFINLSTVTGTYPVFYASPGPCPDTARFDIQILPRANAAFAYIPAQYCRTSPKPLPVILGDSGGVFSVAQGNTSLNGSTGEINLGSAPGADSLLIRYTVAGGDCPDSTLFLVNIFAVDTSISLSYPKADYCPDDPNPVPTLSGSRGGSFQAQPPGLDIGQFSGQIDLATSQPGTYLVRYYPPGACTDSSGGFYLKVHPRKNIEGGYPKASYCQGEGLARPVNLTGSAGVFSASTGIIFDNAHLGTIALGSSVPGAYLIRYTTSGFCPVDTAFALTIYPNPDLLIVNSATSGKVCEGDQVDFAAFGGDQYAFWKNDSLMQDYSVNNQLRAGFSLADSGWMRVGARLTLGGCEVRDSVKIAVIPAPRITHLEYGTKVTSGADLQINLQTDLPGSVIHWAYVGNVAVLPPLDSGQSPALPQNGLWELNVPLFLADDTHLGEAMFFLHPENGDCQGRVDSVRINILPDGQDIFAPGVFTPNGDGKNDVWQIVWTDRVNPFDYMVSVFNRAGGRVFVRDGLAGTWTGDALPDGVYWYVIRRNDGQRDYAGGLTIRRR